MDGRGQGKSRTANIAWRFVSIPCPRRCGETVVFVPGVLRHVRAHSAKKWEAVNTQLLFIDLAWGDLGCFLHVCTRWDGRGGRTARLAPRADQAVNTASRSRIGVHVYASILPSSLDFKCVLYRGCRLLRRRKPFLARLVLKRPDKNCTCPWCMFTTTIGKWQVFGCDRCEELRQLGEGFMAKTNACGSQGTSMSTEHVVIIVLSIGLCLLIFFIIVSRQPPARVLNQPSPPVIFKRMRQVESPRKTAHANTANDIMF